MSATSKVGEIRTSPYFVGATDNFAARKRQELLLVDDEDRRRCGITKGSCAIVILPLRSFRAQVHDVVCAVPEYPGKCAIQVRIDETGPDLAKGVKLDILVPKTGMSD